MAYRIAKKADRTNVLCLSKNSKHAVLVMYDSMNMYDGVIYDRVAKSAYSAKIPFECILFPMEEFDKLNIEYDQRGYSYVLEDNFDNVIKTQEIIKKPKIKAWRNY